MAENEVLIDEFISVDTFAYKIKKDNFIHKETIDPTPGSVALGEVSGLNDKITNDTMNGRSLVGILHLEWAPSSTLLYISCQYVRMIVGVLGW